MGLNEQTAVKNMNQNKTSQNFRRPKKSSGPRKNMGPKKSAGQRKNTGRTNTDSNKHPKEIERSKNEVFYKLIKSKLEINSSEYILARYL